MVKLNFQRHYSSLQCHMIFQKSSNHSNMLIWCSKTILLIINVEFFFLLLNIFVKTMILFDEEKVR